MLCSILSELFDRDLTNLKTEIAKYSSDDNLWKTSDGITNPGGNLSLHIIGNLNHFIGSVLGNSGYIRNREAEFASSGIQRAAIIADVEVTAATIRDVLAKLDEKSLEDIYPVEVFGRPMTTGFFLVHLTAHLSYHLGQINYHRRLLDR